MSAARQRAEAVPLTTNIAAQAARAAFMEERILRAAEEAFARHGLNGTRVREIAAAAGVNGATLYNYYPSKSALYEAVLDRTVQPLIESIRAFANGPRDQQSVQALVATVMRHLAAHPHLPRLVYLEAIAEGAHVPRLAAKWFRPLLEQIVGMLEGAPASAALEATQYPVVAALFLHVSLGHFALAPLLKEVFGADPLSADGVARQTRFIETLTDRLFPSLNPRTGKETP